MQRGVVTFYDETKGFGFIQPNDMGTPIFVHRSDLQDRIRLNDSVVYDVEQGKKGIHAVNVRVIG